MENGGRILYIQNCVTSKNLITGCISYSNCYLNLSFFFTTTIFIIKYSISKHSNLICIAYREVKLGVRGLDNRNYFLTINNLMKDIDETKSHWKVKTGELSLSLQIIFRGFSLLGFLPSSDREGLSMYFMASWLHGHIYECPCNTALINITWSSWSLRRPFLNAYIETESCRSYLTHKTVAPLKFTLQNAVLSNAKIFFISEW